MSQENANVIDKYLNKKGEYCPLKSENVRKEYKFNRLISPRLAKKKALKEKTDNNSERIMAVLLS